VFDQFDVGLALRVLNATELLGHREEVSGHLARVHQEHGPAGSTQMMSLATREHVSTFMQQDAAVVALGGWREG